MKLISLTQGMVSIVDDDDFEFLSQWKWYACATGHGDYFYAVRNVTTKGENRLVYMHRVIVKARGRIKVDHFNCDTLDNQKSNLRLASKSQNGANAKVRRDSTSGLKGVSWHKRIKRWQAQIGNNPRTSLGYFETPEQAALAYDVAAVTAFGEFALTNRSLGLLK